MIITIKGYDFKIDTKQQSYPVLVIENQLLFRKIISNLLYLNNDSERDILIRNGENYTPLKRVKVFTDYFNISLNDKTFLTKIYANIEQKLFIEYDAKLELESLIYRIKELLREETMDYEPNLSVEDEVDTAAIFKLFGLKFEENKKDAKDTFYKYLDICFELKVYDLFVFVNLSKYVNEEELYELYQYMNYHQLEFLCIEYKKYGKIKGENIYVIDEDFLETNY